MMQKFGPCTIRLLAKSCVLLLLVVTVAQSQLNNNEDSTCPCAEETSISDSSILISTCDPNDEEFCQQYCVDLQGPETTYLNDKCCVHTGKSASILAFEEDAKWVKRLAEFNKCTGANVRLDYLPEGEDGMADALKRDVGEDSKYNSGTTGGEGIFDAYIVQAPWLPPVVEGLENLSPRIRESADTIRFLDINPASRSAVSFNGTVRALPLDSDYVAIGWRQDAFYKHGVELSPPRTIAELADLSEQLNGLDHNDDGEPDWGVCLTPQVNYFYAFVAPLLQTTLTNPQTGLPTGQNIFFDVDTFEPLIHGPGFKFALEQYWRVIRASNCQTQLALGEKCDRKSAFPTGRCPMVVSMPGTLTSFILPDGKRAPRDRIDDLTGNITWSIEEQPLGPGGTHWGRRAVFPGSKVVESWREEDRDEQGRALLVSCDADREVCPLADANGVNYAAFFAEGGEAYALNGRQSKLSARDVMWDVFTWLSELPATQLPLSGQYRQSHLSEEAKDELLNEGWPNQAVDDLFDVLGAYFRKEEDGGNPVQDLLMLGFPEYMSALDEELHIKLLGVKVGSPPGGFFDISDPSKSIDPVEDFEIFDRAFEDFVNSLEERWLIISQSMSGGVLGQLQRWRQSLSLPWKTDVELCSTAISMNTKAFRNLECENVVNFELLCQTQSDDVARYDPDLCAKFYGGVDDSNTALLASAIVVPLVVLAIGLSFLFHSKNNDIDALWKVRSSELHFDDPPKVIGQGAFGEVLLADFRGTAVAVKQVLPPLAIEDSNNRESITDSGESSTDTLRRQRASQPKNRMTSWVGLDSSEGDFSGGQSVGTTSIKNMDTTQYLRRTSKRTSASLSKGEHKNAFVREMRLLSKLRHPCIVTVMGAVMKENEIPQLIMEYMELGSLYEVLHNKTISLDGDLILPILQQVAQGLRYLHSFDPPIIHGDLKAKNILVDGQFRAKISDFGLSSSSGTDQSRAVNGTPYWMAPELLEGKTKNTTASDVYAFGITLFEVYARQNPYEGENYDEVIRGVCDSTINKRPPVPNGCPEKMAFLMRDCLEADPAARPTFEENDLRMKRMSSENVEPGLEHLSYYARKELTRTRANKLLYNVFPAHVAEALRDGRKVEPEHHGCVTIFFSDIVGYTSISENMTSLKVCDMLDRLYHKFDDLSKNHGVFKIETIGDAYLGITNLATDQTRDHVKRIAEFSIDAIRAASQTLIDEEDPSKGTIQIRVGFHTGPVISNVVGSRLPKYSVYGDTVNTSARMESNSESGLIHCTEASAKLLKQQAPDMPLYKRGGLKIKGKEALMTTYWVNQPGKDIEERETSLPAAGDGVEQRRSGENLEGRRKKRRSILGGRVSTRKIAGKSSRA